MNKQHRVLVIAHGHPDFSMGGGELAAYNLYRSLASRRDVASASFLGRVEAPAGASGRISLRRPGEYLWEQGVSDWHLMTAAHPESVLTWFAELLRRLVPTVVFVHHYAHLGLEFIRVLRRELPDARVVLTLHEFMAICGNNGQMVKTQDMKLCSRESMEDCHRCFPERSPEDFWLRKHRFARTFELVDRFVAPSEFLRDRYVDWGIAPSSIATIENGQQAAAALPPRSLGRRDTRRRFGFFGQVNPYKGLPLLLQALEQAAQSRRCRIELEVHGANLEIQTAEFRRQVEDSVAKLTASGHLHWAGAYRPEELRQRMADIDWVVVPSLWWENSPMVIQEAFACGRPVICSNIGGMAEKVRNGVDGLHVQVGNAARWAEKLEEAASFTTEWDDLRNGIRRPPSYEASADAYLDWACSVDPSRSASVVVPLTSPRRKRATA